jgi:chemotaxis protein MotB
MTKVLGLLLVVVLAAAAAFYLLRHRPQQEALQAAEQARAAGAQENAALRGRVADLEAIRDQLQRSGTELQEKVLEKEKELSALRSTQDDLLSELKSEIADKTVQVERIRDQLRVDMVDEVLFDSGEAVLKPAGVTILTKVGGVLAKAANRRVEVQGHTDNVPITGALAKRFPTNWELSVARATNVVRFLQEQAGLDPRLLSAAGYSEYRPKGPNDDDRGRRQNRRIEILLVPVPPAEAPASDARKGN